MLALPFSRGAGKILTSWMKTLIFWLYNFGARWEKIRTLQKLSKPGSTISKKSWHDSWQTSKSWLYIFRRGAGKIFHIFNENFIFLALQFWRSMGKIRRLQRLSKVGSTLSENRRREDWWKTSKCWLYLFARSGENFWHLECKLWFSGSTILALDQKKLGCCKNFQILALPF